MYSLLKIGKISVSICRNQDYVDQSTNKANPNINLSKEEIEILNLILQNDKITQKRISQKLGCLLSNVKYGMGD